MNLKELRKESGRREARRKEGGREGGEKEGRTQPRSNTGGQRPRSGFFFPGGTKLNSEFQWLCKACPPTQFSRSVTQGGTGH